jgi:hypothetical protein
MTELDDEFDREYHRGKKHLCIAFSKLYCKNESLFKCYQSDSISKDKCPECRKLEIALAESDYT